MIFTSLSSSIPNFSFTVGVVCFAYLAFYAIRVTKILKAQGIELDQIKSEGAH